MERKYLLVVQYGLQKFDSFHLGNLVFQLHSFLKEWSCFDKLAGWMWWQFYGSQDVENKF